MVGDAPWSIAAGAARVFDVVVRAAASPRAEFLRLGLAADGVDVVQPAAGVLSIRVEATAGQDFPMLTAAGGFVPLDLEASYSNFPNPFAAGRDATAFVYALDRGGTVTLRVFTARGELVRTVLDGASRTTGLHQDDRWDGRNGRGVAVNNGVYVAELRVEYDDGESARVVRKIAVVR